MNEEREKEIRKEAEDKIMQEKKNDALARERHFGFAQALGSEKANDN